MIRRICLSILFVSLLLVPGLRVRAAADPETYLSEVRAELQKRWPDNRTVNIVFHGHSVPAGYARTPLVNTLDAYPHRTLALVKEKYPIAVVNVITTAIGGEQSEQGAARFESEVLCHRPDVLLIDYALNDRMIGLERSEAAWRRMIETALARGIKVILLTPTPDLSEDIRSDAARLAAHAAMIRRLADEYGVGLADAYAAFRRLAEAGERIADYMSQVNHPNARGHEVVAAEIIRWF